MDNVSRGKIDAAVQRAEDQAWTAGYQSAVSQVEQALYGGESDLYAWLLAARKAAT